MFYACTAFAHTNESQSPPAATCTERVKNAGHFHPFLPRCRAFLLFLIISPALCSRTLPVFVLSRCLCTREAARAHDGRCRRAIAWPLWCGNTGYRRSGPEVEPVTRGCTAVPRHGEDTRAASKVFSTPARTAESAPKSAGQAHPGVQPSAHGQKQNRRYVQAEHRRPPQRVRSRVLSKFATQAHSGATPARTVAGPFEIRRSGTSRCPAQHAWSQVPSISPGQASPGGVPSTHS